MSQVSLALKVAKKWILALREKYFARISTEPTEVDIAQLKKLTKQSIWGLFISFFFYIIFHNSFAPFLK